MAKQRGHRANKANDSFGTVNNDQLYRGKYREEVYQDDDETVEATDPSQEEATPEQESESFAQAPKGSETDYKKRYDDLKRHYDTKLDEWKKEREELSSARQAGKDSGLSASELPKTPAELDDFKAKYPDVYAIVETVSSMQAQTKLESLKNEIDTLKDREQELEVQSAYKELVSAHPDFNDLKTDEKFLMWLDEQPASIADGIYKNNKDARWAIRVVDLYKADVGAVKKPKKSTQDPAAVVTKTTAKDVVNEASGEQKVWKASEIGKMKPWQFEKVEAEIDAARAEGRIDYSQQLSHKET